MARSLVHWKNNSLLVKIITRTVAFNGTWEENYRRCHLSDENGLASYCPLIYGQMSMTMQSLLPSHHITLGNDQAPASAEDLEGHPNHSSVLDWSQLSSWP